MKYKCKETDTIIEYKKDGFHVSNKDNSIVINDEDLLNVIFLVWKDIFVSDEISRVKILALNLAEKKKLLDDITQLYAKVNVRSMETFAIKNRSVGDSFYTHKTDKDITAIASYYGKKVKTEKLYAMDSKHTTITRITKVTIVSN